MIFSIIILIFISIFITILDFILDIIQWIKESKLNTVLGEYIQDRTELFCAFIIPCVNLVALIVLCFSLLKDSQLNLRKLFHYE